MLHWLGGFIDKCSRHDARGDSNDGITQQHHHRREEFPRRGHRGDVAKSHSGHRHDGVIDRSAQIGELRVGCVALYNVHQCADAGDQDEDKEKKDQNLVETPAQRFQEEVALIEEAEETKHAKHANEPYGAKQKHIARSGENERQIGRKGGDEVDDAKETQCISHGTSCAIETCRIVEGEDHGKDVLQNLER